jgi:hypothetical protein
VAAPPSAQPSGHGCGPDALVHEDPGEATRLDEPADEPNVLGVEKPGRGAEEGRKVAGCCRYDVGKVHRAHDTTVVLRHELEVEDPDHVSLDEVEQDAEARCRNRP